MARLKGKITFSVLPRPKKTYDFSLSTALDNKPLSKPVLCYTAFLIAHPYSNNKSLKFEYTW